MALKERQKQILAVLTRLGGEASTRQIAKDVDLHVNGVSQSLSAMHELVTCLGGRGGDIRWRLRNPETNLHLDFKGGSQ